MSYLAALNGSSAKTTSSDLKEWLEKEEGPGVCAYPGPQGEPERFLFFWGCQHHLI